MTGILLGLGFGGFLALTVYGIRPPRPSLAAALAALHRPAEVPRHTEVPGPCQKRGWATRLGQRAVPALKAGGLPGASLRSDLLVAEMPVEQLLAEKAAASLAGLLAPSMAAALLWSLAGITPGWQLPATASLALAAVLFFTPDLAVRATARKRRRELRHTLSVFLNLTVIALAGGAGIHQALADAAAGTQGWAASQLRRAMTASEMARTSVWQEFAELGRRTKVRELTELAATISLAGSEGARIRASLEAKASAIRTRRLTEADGAAQAATERMSLPVVVLFAGFLTFIGFPALENVLAGL